MPPLTLAGTDGALVGAITAQRRRQWRLALVQRTLPASQGSASLPPYCSTR